MEDEEVADAALMNRIPPQNGSQHGIETTPSANLTKRTQTKTTAPFSTPDTLRTSLAKPNQNWAYFTYTPSIAWAFRPSPAIPLRDHYHDHDPSKPRASKPSSIHHHRHSNHNHYSNNDPPSNDKNDASPINPSDNHPSANSEAPAPDPEPEAQEHTYTLRSLNVGYLDDEVILGIGIDDQGQGVARVRAEELLGCLKMCPQKENRKS